MYSTLAPYSLSTEIFLVASRRDSGLDSSYRLNGSDRRGSVFEGRENILFFQKRVIFQNLAMGGTGTEEAQDVTDTQAVAAEYKGFRHTCRVQA